MAWPVENNDRLRPRRLAGRRQVRGVSVPAIVPVLHEDFSWIDRTEALSILFHARSNSCWATITLGGEASGAWF